MRELQNKMVRDTDSRDSSIRSSVPDQTGLSSQFTAPVQSTVPTQSSSPTQSTAPTQPKNSDEPNSDSKPAESTQTNVQVKSS